MPGPTRIRRRQPSRWCGRSRRARAGRVWSGCGSPRSPCWRELPGRSAVRDRPAIRRRGADRVTASPSATVPPSQPAADARAAVRAPLPPTARPGRQGVHQRREADHRGGSRFRHRRTGLGAEPRQRCLEALAVEVLVQQRVARKRGTAGTGRCCRRAVASPPNDRAASTGRRCGKCPHHVSAARTTRPRRTAGTRRRPRPRRLVRWTGRLRRGCGGTRCPAGRCRRRAERTPTGRSRGSAGRARRGRVPR